MARDDLEVRKRLTFAQAEGLEPLPTQLSKTDMPRKLRAKLWEIFKWLLDRRESWNQYDTSKVSTIWYVIYIRYWIDVEGNFGDTFKNNREFIERWLRDKFVSGSYIEIYNFIQFVIQSNNGVPQLSSIIDGILKSELASYRIVDGNIIAPIGSEEEADTIQNALTETQSFGAHGARAHLRNSIEALNNSKFSDSVRESISAVESIAKVIEPDADLSKALAKLEGSAKLHGGVKRAFGALYGYASNQEGIRHSLLFGEHPDVDETDALFMIGACSSFVTYLIGKAQAAGITLSRNDSP